MPSYSQNQVLSLESLKVLSVHAGSADVTIKPYDGEPYVQMSVVQNGIYLGSPELEVEQGGGRTRISVKTHGLVLGLGLLRIRLDIRIPADSVREINVRVASGRLGLDSFSFDRITGQLTSGEMRMERTSARSADFDVTSGNLYLNDVTCSGDAKLILTSGSIKATLATVHECELECSAVSGDMKVSGAFTSIRAGTLSGNTRIRSSIVPGAITGKVTSGNMSLHIPQTDEGFTANYSCGSGAFLTDFKTGVNKRKGAIVMGSGKASYMFTIASGFASLKQLR